MSTRVIYQYVAHDLSCYGEELCPILPNDRLPANQSKVSFVNQRRSLQSVVSPLITEIVFGRPAQLNIESFKEGIHRLLIASGSPGQKLGYFTLRSHRHVSVNLSGW